MGTQQNSKNKAIDTPSSPNNFLENLESSCEQLRDWHQSADEQIKRNFEEIEKREAEFNKLQTELASEKEELRKMQRKVQSSRKRLSGEAASIRTEKATISEEKQAISQLRKELEIDRREVRILRKQLDKEWSSLKQIRKAQEEMAIALESDRLRISEIHYKSANQSHTTIDDDDMESFRLKAA